MLLPFAVQEPPFVFKHVAEDGNVKYSGYCVDLFDLIVDKVNEERLQSRGQLHPVQYSMYDVAEYGKKEKQDGEDESEDEKEGEEEGDMWTGAVGEVLYDVR